MSETRTLEDTIDQYLNGFDNLNTVRAYGQILKPFAVDFGRQRSLDSITPDDIERWDLAMRDAMPPIAKATLMSRRKTMKIFWNWCVKHEFVAISPARFLKIKKQRNSLVTKAIPSEVLSAMLEQVNRKRASSVVTRDTAILSLMITYGARAGDVARLPLSNINLREEWIVLHVKGDNEIRLPVPPQTGRHLAAWLEIRRSQIPDPPHSFVFTTNRTAEGNRYGPMASSSISTLIKRLSKEVCGIAYGPHSIRHWFGQHHADNRTPPTILRDIMGHSDVKITLDHYYNQDFDRIGHVLNETEMGRDLLSKPISAVDPDQKGKILRVNFKSTG